MNELKKLINGIKGIGLGNALRTLQYSNYKTRMDKRYWAEKRKSQKELRIPGRISEVKGLKRGVQLRFQRGIELEIIFLTESMVRTTWTPGKLPVPYAIDRVDWEDTKVEFLEVNDTYVIKSELVKLVIHPCGSISYYSDENLVRHENPPRLTGEEWTLTADLPEDVKVFGMGEQANRLDLRGNSFTLWNTDPGGSYKFKEEPLYMPLPVYSIIDSDRSYLIFHENSHKGKSSFEENISFSFMGGAFRTYFIAGDIQKITKNFSELTGRAKMPPVWSLGFHQSRWGYKSDADIRRIANGYLDNDLPLSAIHLDIDYMYGYRVFTIDKERYPDLKQLSADMEKEGIKLVTILDPAVKIDLEYVVFQEGVKNNYFCKISGEDLRGLVWPGWAAFPDFTKPATREWWKKKYSILLNEGIAGIWHDMNEPASFINGDDSTLPLATQHDLEGRGGDHLEGHNLYGFMMNKAGCEAQRELRPEKRPWLLTRSGWVGVQRYAWHWTGDVETSWQALRLTLTGLLNLGMSGIPFSGSDIGGFSGRAEDELFTRWIQLAAFTPFFRNHAGCETKNSEPWEYSQETVDIVRGVLQVREHLLPYIYTTSWQATKFGYPLMRPMFWDNQNDTGLLEIEDSFYFGDHLLIAPIFEEGQEKREVFLPEGEWYDFYSNKRHIGGKSHNIEVTLKAIPIFVRAGAVIPENQNGERILNLYLTDEKGKNVTSVVFSDSGEGYGENKLEEFDVITNGKEIILNRKTTGKFELPEFSVLNLIGRKVEVISIDGKQLKINNRLKIKSEFSEILITLN